MVFNRLFLISIIISCSLSPTFAQNYIKIDSLKNSLQTHQNQDTTKVNLLNEIAAEYTYSLNDSVFQYADEAFLLSEKNKYDKGKANALYNYGFYYYLNNNYTKSIVNLQKALDIYTKINSVQKIANCNNYIARIHYFQKNYDIALQYTLAELSVIDKTNNRIKTSDIYAFIGIIYEAQNINDSSLVYLKRSVEINTHLQRYDALLQNYNNIANIYLKEKKYLLVEEYLQKALDVSSRCSTVHYRSIAIMYVNFAELYNLTADSTHSTDDYKTALGFGLKAMVIAENIDHIYAKKAVYSCLKISYTGLQDFEKALYYTELYMKITDSIYNIDKTNEIQNLEAKYKFAQSEKEIDLLKTNLENEVQINRIKIIIAILIIFSLLMLIILLVIIGKKRQKEILKDKLLKKTEEKLSELFNNIPVGIYRANTQGEIFHANPAMIQMLGYLDKNDLLSSNIDDLIIDSEQKINILKLIYENKTLNNYSIELKKKNGEIINALISAKISENENDQINIEGSLLDITDKTKAEKAIIKSENKLNAVINSIPDMIFYKNTKGTYTGCNKAFADYLDINQKEIIEKTDIDFFTKEEAILFKEIDKNTINGEYSENHQVWSLNPKNEKVFLDTKKAPIIDEKGEVFGIVGISRDLTQVKLAEQKIKKLSLAVEQSPVIIIITDITGVIEYVNSTFYKTTGYAQEEIIGKNTRLLKSGYTTQVEYEELWSTITAGKSWSGTFLNVKKNNEKYWEKTLISPLIDDSGKITNYIAIKEDITKLVKAEDELKLKTTKIKNAHKEITDSIEYAKTIQYALLSNKKIIDKYLTSYFIFFKPKDNLSGDFYYVNKIDDYLILVVADCTGHGVPGALLTILGITYIHDIIRRKETDTASEVLNILRERIKNTFKSFGTNNQHGLDIAFCAVNTKTHIMQYAGAYNSLVILRNNELIEYKATRNPIGFYHNEISFKNNIIQLEDNDSIYLYSDGFQDQLGGKYYKKYRSNNFKQFLQKIHELPMSVQKQKLENELEDWKGDGEQTDDILVLSVKYNDNN